MNVLLPLASICLVVYVSAFPVFSLLLLRKNKERVKHDQILRAHGEGNDRLINPNYTFRRKFQRLYHLFKPGKWYWILLILLREFMIAFTSLMFRTSPVYQLAMTLLVVFAAYVLQVRNQPYMSSNDFEQVVEEHRKKVKEGDKLHVRIQVTIDECRSKNTDKTRVNSVWAAQQKKLEQKRGYLLVSERIVQYLTDFNTVESILLASAILVNLCGIMFLSSRFDGDSMEHYKSDYETLGILCMIVVCVSFVYWVLVFSFEMLATFRPTTAIRVAAACTCSRHNVVGASSTNNVTQLSRVKKGGRSANRKSAIHIDMQQNPLSSAIGNAADIAGASCESTDDVEVLQRQLQDAHTEIAQLKQSLELKSTADSHTPYALGKQKREFPQYRTFRHSKFGKKTKRKVKKGSFVGTGTDDSS